MSLSLEDRLELFELPGRYGDIIDAKTWDRLDRIFTEDAVFRLADYDISMDGLNGIKAFMAETDMHPLSHLMMNVYADPDGAGRARLFVRAILAVEDETSESRGHKFVFGAYTDRAVKTGAGWRIRDRIFNLNHRPVELM